MVEGLRELRLGRARQRREIHAGLPNSELVIFENSGPSPQVEEHDLWIEKVCVFLARQRTPDRKVAVKVSRHHAENADRMVRDHGYSLSRAQAVKHIPQPVPAIAAEFFPPTMTTRWR